MPIRLSDLKAATKTITIPVPGTDDTLTITYRLGEMTPERVDRLDELMEQPHTTSELWAMTLAIIVSWDLLDDEDQPIPVTPEAIASVPSPVLSWINRRIAEDAHANPPTEPR